MEKIWWVVKVFDKESHTTTTIGRFGLIENIKSELETEGLWQFVSAEPEVE